LQKTQINQVIRLEAEDSAKELGWELNPERLVISLAQPLFSVHNWRPKPKGASKCINLLTALIVATLSKSTFSKENQKEEL
jgi:hypothetical protein